MSDAPSYRPLDSLAAAREAPDGFVVLEGDWGGQIYVVAPAGLVLAGEDALRRLLRELDAIAWPGNDPGGACVRFERLAEGESLPGGLGGAHVTDEVWIHPELDAHAQGIVSVLEGRSDSLAPSAL